MYFGLGHAHEAGHPTERIHQGVHFDAPFFPPSINGVAAHPAQQVAEQAKGGAVDDLQVAYAQTFQPAVRQKTVVPLEQHVVDGLEGLPVALGVGVRQRAPCGGLQQPQMVQLPFARQHALADLPQPVTAGEDAIQQRCQMGLQRKFLIIPV